MSPLLSVQGLTVSRGKAGVLRDLSFDVSDGEIVTLLGSNGVGKSTALRTVSGLHDVTRGSITFEGRDLVGLSPRAIVDAGVVHVPEGRQLFPGLSVRENLQLGAFVKGRSGAGRLAAVVDRIPLVAPLLSRTAGSLSGGEQQLVAIARGLVCGPRLLLLDEPSLGLAPVVVDRIVDIFLQLRQDGTTVLVVEQNTALALDVADRGYVLAGGAVVLSGSAAELRADKAVRAAYLGV